MLGLLHPQWGKRYPQVVLGPQHGFFAWHWYRHHCSEHIWQWQKVADTLNLLPGDLVFKIFGASFEQWPLPSWPEAVKVLPRSLPDKEWEEHNERIYKAPWFFERGFTRAKLHFTGPEHDRYQVDGYTPVATATAGNSTDRGVATLPVKALPAPLRGSVARAAVSYDAPDAETEMEEVTFKADPGEPFHGTQFLRSVANDRFNRMGWEKPGMVFAGFIDREVNQWILLAANLAC